MAISYKILDKTILLKSSLGIPAIATLAGSNTIRGGLPVVSVAE